ncbi:TPA: LOW QUALITY PROTEIN: hypothetical protein N0F65_011275 [Lagenidium giganteum]|uniref:Ste24 endopeptidase n=1 Tax=Lagenidium giganteum TaxID=4803 RepID=A0AAV2YUN6_9STRA|nr:TPA: LOW QUALITY PROTEIN: hypothetical protein N0F65_011275 [Lagenidium giganteum]
MNVPDNDKRGQVEASGASHPLVNCQHVRSSKRNEDRTSVVERHTTPRPNGHQNRSATFTQAPQHQKLKEKDFPKALADGNSGLACTTRPKKTKESEEDEATPQPTKEVSGLEAAREKFDQSRAYRLEVFRIKAVTILLLGYLPYMWTVSGSAGLNASNEIYRVIHVHTLMHNTIATLPFSRNEFRADAFAADLGYAQALLSGLCKVYIENLDNMNPDKLYSTYYYTHPPLLERLNAITEREKKTNASYYTEAGWTPGSPGYFQATLVFITIVYLFETYLDYRQHQKLKEKAFPAALADAISGLGAYTPQKTTKNGEDTNDEHDEDDGHTDTKNDEAADDPAKEVSLLDATRNKFDESRAYGLDTSAFGFVSGAYSQLETTAFLLRGFLPYMWTWHCRERFRSGCLKRNLPRNGVSHAEAVRETVVGMPFSLYSTFVIEERHGFNNQTLKLFFMDTIKDLAVTLVTMYPVCAAVIFVIHWGGEYFYVYAWCVLLVYSIVMRTIYPVFIMPLFDTFTPLEKGELRTRIEALASSLNFPLTQLFVVDGSTRSNHSNAYFYGTFTSKGIVLYDTLLEQSTDDEILAVLGHELGHWKLSHTAQDFLIEQVHTFVCLYVFGRCMNDAALFSSFGFESSSHPVVIGFVLFNETIWAPVEHVLSFLMTLNTRRNEFQADAFAVGLGHAKALKSGLCKTSIDNLDNKNPDKLYSAYHYSHPPLVERLNAIKEREKKMQ